MFHSSERLSKRAREIDDDSETELVKYYLIMPKQCKGGIVVKLWVVLG